MTARDHIADRAREPAAPVRAPGQPARAGRAAGDGGAARPLVRRRAGARRRARGGVGAGDRRAGVRRRARRRLRRAASSRAGTPAGRALLAHELAHVVQQRAPGDAEPDAAEAEARRAVDRRSAGSRRVLRTGRQLALQAEGEEQAVARRPRPATRDARRARVGRGEFQEERLSFARDRDRGGHVLDRDAASPSCASARRPSARRCGRRCTPSRSSSRGALTDSAELLAAADPGARGARGRGGGRQGRDRRRPARAGRERGRTSTR